MEPKKGLFSEKVTAGSRTYFFDVKESSKGARYLIVSESKNTGDSHEQNRVMVFEEHIRSFKKGLEKAVGFMVK